MKQVNQVPSQSPTRKFKIFNQNRKKLSAINELAEEKKYGSALSMERYTPKDIEEYDYDYFADAGYKREDLQQDLHEEIREDPNFPKDYEQRDFNEFF